MKKIVLLIVLILGLAFVIFHNSRNKNSNLAKLDQRQWTVEYMSNIIDDTITLRDNHIYYKVRTGSGSQPFHSQYCKNH